VFDAYVLRLIDVRDPTSLYELQLRDRFGRLQNASLHDFELLSKENPAFTDAFAYRPVFARRDGAPMMLQLVTGNFFSLLGVNVALGRTLTIADDAVPDGSPVLVRSHRITDASGSGVAYDAGDFLSCLRPVGSRLGMTRPS
jgi:hypothetical protein